MEMMRAHPEYFLNAAQEITSLINDANKAMFNKDDKEFSSSLFRLKGLLADIGFKVKWEEFQNSKSKNMQFRFLTIYSNMVKRLLEFIEASRTRNWLQHLSSAEALM